MELRVRERWAHLHINPYHSDLDGHGRLASHSQYESCCRHSSGPAAAGCWRVSNCVSCTYRKGNRACCYPTLPILLHFLFFLPSSSRRCHRLMSLSQKKLRAANWALSRWKLLLVCSSWKGHCPRPLIFRPLPAFPTCLFCIDSRKTVFQGHQTSRGLVL